MQMMIMLPAKTMMSFQRLALVLATAITLGATHFYGSERAGVGAWAKPLPSSVEVARRSSSSSLSEPDPSFAVSVKLGGTTYVNKVCFTSLCCFSPTLSLNHSLCGRMERGEKESTCVGDTDCGYDLLNRGLWRSASSRLIS